MKKLLSITLIVSLILIIPSTFAHTGDDHGDEAIAAQTMDAILPFVYISQGKYFSAILIIIFWFVILKGLYELAMLMLGRASHSNKNKK